MVSHNDVRIKRMNIIKESWNKSKNPNEDLLIGKCCMEWGTTPKTIKEYLKVLRMAGEIK